MKVKEFYRGLHKKQLDDFMMAFIESYGIEDAIDHVDSIDPDMLAEFFEDCDKPSVEDMITDQEFNYISENLVEIIKITDDLRYLFRYFINVKKYDKFKAEKSALENYDNQDLKDWVSFLRDFVVTYKNDLGIKPVKYQQRIIDYANKLCVNGEVMVSDLYAECQHPEIKSLERFSEFLKNVLKLNIKGHGRDYRLYSENQRVLKITKLQKIK